MTILTVFPMIYRIVIEIYILTNILSIQSVHINNMSTKLEEYVYLAKLAEQAERYEGK